MSPGFSSPFAYRDTFARVATGTLWGVPAKIRVSLRTVILKLEITVPVLLEKNAPSLKAFAIA